MKVGEIWKIKPECPHRHKWAEDRLKLVKYLSDDLWEIEVIDFSGAHWWDDEVISGKDLYENFYKCEDQSWPERKNQGRSCKPGRFGSTK